MQVDNINTGHNEYPTKYIQWRIGARVDGWFGSETASKVKVWQRSRGLYSDGSVGPLSWKALLQ